MKHVSEAGVLDGVVSVVIPDSVTKVLTVDEVSPSPRSIVVAGSTADPVSVVVSAPEVDSGVDSSDSSDEEALSDGSVVDDDVDTP